MNTTKRYRLILGSVFFALMFVNIGSVGYSTIYRLTKTSLRGWNPDRKKWKAHSYIRQPRQALRRRCKSVMKLSRSKANGLRRCQSFILRVRMVIGE